MIQDYNPTVTDEPLRIKQNLDEWFDPQEHQELRDLKPGETKTVILEVDVNSAIDVIEICGASE